MADDPINDPNEWRQVMDKKQNKPYYYNKKAKITQWEEPACMKAQRKKSPWRSRVDPDSGRTYYYNKATKATTWDKPADFDGVPAKASAVSHSAQKKDPTPAKANNPEPVKEAIVQAAVQQSSAKPAASKPAPKPAEKTGGDDYQRATFSDSDEEPVQKQQHARQSSVVTFKREGDDQEPGFDEGAVDSFDKALEKHNPTTLAAMIQLRHNIVLKERRAENGGDSDDDESGTPGYELTKHRHGFVNRFFRIGKAYDSEQLLSFKKSLIKKSLLKTNRQHDEQAVQMFKNIMSFMGDRKSGKHRAAHATKIIKNALLAPIGMRDEVFLQICKQTHKHPKLANCLEGWNLMIICLFSFPPSKNIKVSEYLKRAIEGSTSTEIKERAELARVLLDVIETQGERQEVPPEIEVEAIRSMELIELKVLVPSGQSETIKVDPFTTVVEAEQMMYRKLGLNFTAAFGLFEANSERQDVLPGNRRIMDVISSWDKSLEDEEKVTDVRKQNKRHSKKKEEEVVEKPEYTHLLFQAKLSLPTSPKEEKIDDLVRDPKAIDLLYHQAKRDVLQSRIQPEEKDITKLAAIKLQIDEGDYMPDIHTSGFLIKRMEEYIPKDMMPKNLKSKNGEAKLKTFEQKIMHKYEKLRGLAPNHAKRNYLGWVEGWLTYGVQFFEVEQRKQLKSCPDNLNLGISPNGILLQNPEDKEIVFNYEYKEVVTWGHSESKFILVVGDVVQQKKLVFKTTKGEIMRNLIHSYIHFKVQSKMASNPS